MADVSYSDPRLAAVYDALNPAGEDTAFYLEMAGHTPRTILDMGCGTGQVAVELARLGHRVTGADPAAAMLAIARDRPGGEAVDWIESDAARLAQEARFDLIFMTGHVFQVFLTDDEISAALRNLRRHLAPEGRLVFETRNPSLRPWQGWTREQTRRHMNIAGVGPVEVHYDVTFADDQLVRYETHFRFGEEDPVVAPSALRFTTQDQLASALAQAGFRDVRWYGNWDRSPVSPTSPEIIVDAALGSRDHLRY
ncbi:class I SAM-dependent methyltransferase [Mesorhizobium sp. ANAO-SY3R2]|uniref:class I SAM-dependent methyltransferase n=1 Tax=Mesorhizobium sp. ANAO-SY3R2 TaxID=3166644 RepID=UPI003670D13D